MSAVVLITGASTGIGRLAAETAARAGHTVYAGMRDIATRNAGAAQSLRDLAGAEELSVYPLGHGRPSHRLCAASRRPSPKRDWPPRCRGQQCRPDVHRTRRGLHRGAGPAPDEREFHGRLPPRPRRAAAPPRAAHRPDRSRDFDHGPSRVSGLRPVLREQVRTRGVRRGIALRTWRRRSRERHRGARTVPVAVTAQQSGPGGHRPSLRLRRVLRTCAKKLSHSSPNYSPPPPLRERRRWQMPSLAYSRCPRGSALCERCADWISEPTPSTSRRPRSRRTCSAPEHGGCGATGLVKCCATGRLTPLQPKWLGKQEAMPTPERGCRRFLLPV